MTHNGTDAQGPEKPLHRRQERRLLVFGHSALLDNRLCLLEHVQRFLEHMRLLSSTGDNRV